MSIFSKLFKKKKKTGCTTCQFNHDIHCNVGSYLAEKGINGFCYNGEEYKENTNGLWFPTEDD